MTDYLPLLAPVLVLGLFMLGLFVLVGYLTVGGGASSRMQSRREEVSPRFLRETVPRLLPWEPSRALADLSSLCRGRAEMSALGGGMHHSRGTMQSRSHPGDAWLAYTVNAQRGYGVAVLRTSASELSVEVKGGVERFAVVTVDGQPLGTVRTDSSEILDPSGRPLGRVARGELITTYGMTNYRDVELNGRRVAEINGNLLHPGQRLGSPPPAFRIQAPDLSPDEERWLLALLALELYTDRNRLNI
jgi:hypothetical protein